MTPGWCCTRDSSCLHHPHPPRCPPLRPGHPARATDPASATYAAFFEAGPAASDGTGLDKDAFEARNAAIRRPTPYLRSRCSAATPSVLRCCLGARHRTLRAGLARAYPTGARRRQSAAVALTLASSRGPLRRASAPDGDASHHVGTRACCCGPMPDLPHPYNPPRLRIDGRTPSSPMLGQSLTADTRCCCDPPGSSGIRSSASAAHGRGCGKPALAVVGPCRQRCLLFSARGLPQGAVAITYRAAGLRRAYSWARPDHVRHRPPTPRSPRQSPRSTPRRRLLSRSWLPD